MVALNRDNSALYPECPECGKSDGIEKAVVVKNSEDSSFYDVVTYYLVCGHRLEDPDAQLEEGVVELFQLQHPEMIEVK